MCSDRCAVVTACQMGNWEVVEAMLAAGVDPDQRTTGYQTGLHLAALGQHREVIVALHRHNAHPNLKDTLGQTALYVAARESHCSELSCLLLAGSDPDLQDRDGYTAMHIAASRGQMQVLELLLGAGADANIRSGRGATPLLLACAENQAEVPPVLVENSDADLNACDKSGSSALIIATKKGHFDLVLTLLEMGVDANIQDNDHQTALCWASRQEQKHLIEVLMAH